MTGTAPALLHALRLDAARYRETGGWWRSLGFWVVAVHRLSHSAAAVPIPGLRLLLRALAWGLKQPLRVVLHVELPSRARLGPGLALFHPYNVLIGADTVIGEACTLYHEVTLGAGTTQGMPTLGDHVVLFAGARVLGGVTIGERSEVGPNCVVTRSVPPRSLVVAALPRTLPQTLAPRRPEASAGAPTPRPAVEEVP